MRTDVMPTADAPKNDAVEYDAPLPVLGQTYRRDEPLTWKDAPEAVRSAHSLGIVGIVLYSLMTAYYCTLTVASHYNPVMIGITLINIGLVSVNAYMVRCHRHRETSAWGNQRVLSTAGLVFQFPIGTILHGYLLARWFRPETKAWYGLD